MKVRFQADADLNVDIVAGTVRRETGINFQTADEANLRGLPGYAGAGFGCTRK